MSAYALKRMLTICFQTVSIRKTISGILVAKRDLTENLTFIFVVSTQMLRDLISSQLSIVLWGNRKQFGLIPDNEDPDWKIWQEKAYSDFYQTAQQHGIGDIVNRMAYPVIGRIAFEGKRVLEVGPGIIRHLEYIKGKPEKYAICDINEDMLRMSEKQLEAAGIPYDTFLIARESGSELPFADESFDVVISFNSLEHLHPLDNYFNEIKRILKRGGAACRQHSMRRRSCLGTGKIPYNPSLCTQKLQN